LTELETWYRSDSGRYLLQQLSAHLAGELDTAFGYHLTQVGATRCHPLYESSPVRHRIYVANRGGESVGLIAEADELPLASDSVDVVIAHHVLEFSRSPHQALREMHRVLTPQGHLFVIGFNPWSLPGAALALRARAGSTLWRSRRGLSTWRLDDWLSLLGLEQESVSQCFALPPFGGRGLRSAIDTFNQWCTRNHLPVGGAYVVHAIKQVPGNIRPAQRVRRPRLIDIAVPKSVSAPRPAPTPRRGDNAA
jgi:SAM-dependent methyltransferase